MIIGIDIPKNAKVEYQEGDKIYIIFDTKESKTDLWKAALHLWLTEGETVKDFREGKLLNEKRLEVTYKNKFSF